MAALIRDLWLSPELAAAEINAQADADGPPDANDYAEALKYVEEWRLVRAAEFRTPSRGGGGAAPTIAAVGSAEVLRHWRRRAGQEVVRAVPPPLAGALRGAPCGPPA